MKTYQHTFTYILYLCVYRMLAPDTVLLFNVKCYIGRYSVWTYSMPDPSESTEILYKFCTYQMQNRYNERAFSLITSRNSNSKINTIQILKIKIQNSIFFCFFVTYRLYASQEQCPSNWSFSISKFNIMQYNWISNIKMQNSNFFYFGNLL